MATGHTLKAFDEDLDQLRASIAEMGGLAEAAIGDSMRAPVDRDTGAGAAGGAAGEAGSGDCVGPAVGRGGGGAKTVIANGKKLDAREAEVERLAVQIIAL